VQDATAFLVAAGVLTASGGPPGGPVPGKVVLINRLSGSAALSQRYSGFVTLSQKGAVVVLQQEVIQ